jgi:hypothetical protein
LQIRENRAKKARTEEETTERNNKRMFYFAIAANFLYSTGILLNFNVKAIPWLVGSAAVMGLDCIIVMQDV